MEYYHHNPNCNVLRVGPHVRRNTSHIPVDRFCRKRDVDEGVAAEDKAGRDGAELRWFHWREGQPNNYRNQHCVSATRSLEGRWLDSDCRDARAFACQSIVLPPPAPPAPPLPPLPPFHEPYLSTDRLTWHEALAECRRRGRV